MKIRKKTIAGFILLVLCFVTVFGVGPYVNGLMSEKTEIVRIAANVAKGTQIQDSDIEIATVGGYGLPANTMRKKSEVVGKFALVDLRSGDYVFPDKLTDDAISTDNQLRNLNGEMSAISIDVSDLPDSVSGRVQKGDIVSLVVTEGTKSFIPDELRYMRILTTTTADGIDADNVKPDENGNTPVPKTITLYAAPKQVLALTHYMAGGSVQAALVYRGEDSNAQKFLDAQMDILKKSADEVNFGQTAGISEIIISPGASSMEDSASTDPEEE